jgi:hypothetical protein
VSRRPGPSRRCCDMQPGQHVDDRGPVAVADRVIEAARLASVYAARVPCTAGQDAV